MRGPDRKLLPLLARRSASKADLISSALYAIPGARPSRSEGRHYRRDLLSAGKTSLCSRSCRCPAKVGRSRRYRSPVPSIRMAMVSANSQRCFGRVRDPLQRCSHWSEESRGLPELSPVCKPRGRSDNGYLRIASPACRICSRPEPASAREVAHGPHSRNRSRYRSPAELASASESLSPESQEEVAIEFSAALRNRPDSPNKC